KTGNAFGTVGGKVREMTKFSITSPMLPGPMPIYLSRKDAPPTLASILGMPSCGSADEPPWRIPVTLPRRGYQAIREALKQRTAFLNNHFIIGPVIAPEATESDLCRIVQSWIDTYGFDFLKPALQGGALSTDLDQIKPNTEFERQIVTCLRAAL